VPEADGIVTDGSGRRQHPLAILATLGALQALTLGVHALRGKLAAVMLGPPGVGVLGVIEPLVQLVAHLSALGLPIAALRFLSRAHSESTAVFAAAYVRFARAVLLLSLAGTAVALALAVLRPSLLGPDLWRYRNLVVLGILGAPLLSVRDLVTNALAAARATRASASVGLWMAIAAGVGAGAGLLVHPGVAGFLSGTLAGEAVALGLSAIRLRRTVARADAAAPAGAIDAPGARDAADPEESREVAITSLVLWAAYASYPFTHFVARQLVLARSGAAAAGELQAGLELSGLAALLLGPSTALYLAPAVNRRIAIAAKGRAVLRFLTALLPAVALLSLPLVLFPRLAVRLLFSAAFEGATGFLAVLVAAQALRILAGVFHALLVGMGDVRVYGLLVAAGQLSFAALAYAWTPAEGPAGTARAFLVSNVALFALTAARSAWMLSRGEPARDRAAVEAA
jgi:enterobacterial common antigen flippase